MASATGWVDPSQLNPQTLLLDTLFPGFSLLSSSLAKYTKIDLSLYIPTLLVLTGIVFGIRYISQWFWEALETHAMSTADIRVDDEMYNMLMSWIANQKFAKKSRRFVANTNLNSRMWYLWHEFNDEEEKDEVTVDFDANDNPVATTAGKKDKKVRFTPSFGTHYFWYKGHILIFRRQKDQRQTGWGPISEREEISVSSFGRDPTILKVLLDECRAEFMKSDESRTVIYRGGLKSGTSEPVWTRCVSRVSRPFSTVVLDEGIKQNLLDDMRDYLHPNTRRWYSNRGIPYRRGYLLYGPPGTGKSSLSFAIAGYFKLKIYIVSLNSPSMDEENLGTLFAELPKQCVVLLEDIDTAGLTHTRDDKDKDSDSKPLITTMAATTATSSLTPPTKARAGRISLSALLNILDGVASQEGRVLIMTTNHIEKLDEALIRPGRVDMMVKFDLASTSMLSTIFRAIFATLEGDMPPTSKRISIRSPASKSSTLSEKEKLDIKHKEEEEARLEEEFREKKKRDEEKVALLAEEFAQVIPGMTFSPAEIQGFCLKYKRAPEEAAKNAAEWVKTMKTEKIKEGERKLREEKEALEKERGEEEKERKEKEEAEKKEKEEEKKAKEEEAPKVNGVKETSM
ncbi:BCS1 N terminal-domain-containing protein [Halenospora varia]|nr:BCS1 N terminal-domain-containing protein [Halenospora varia]